VRRTAKQSAADGLLASAIAHVAPRAELEVADWAAANVVLPVGVGNPPGPLRFDRTPYMTGDWSPLWAYRRYQTIDCIWAAQTGKTLLMYLTVLYDTATDPGPGMIVYPEKTSGSRRSREHLQPLIRASLPQLVTDVADDMQLCEYHLKTCSWFIGWAGSPSVLSGIPVKHLKLDEEAKYAEKTDKETDAKRLAMRRLVQFGEFGNCFSATTPSTADLPGWRDWEGSTQCQCHVPCRACGHFQVMYFSGEDRHWFAEPAGEWKGGIKWDRSEKLSREQRRESAYYECESCGAHWNDAQKNAAVTCRQWRARNPHARRYAAHLPSWYAPWVKLGDVCDRWWSSYKDESARHDFLNSDAAVPYEIRGRQAETSVLLSHVLPGHKRGQVPPQAVALYLTADVHDDHIRYRVRAWAPDLTSWGVEEGELPPQLHALDAILARTYRRGPDTMPIAYAVIDARWRTDEVYQWCLAHPGAAYPVMGYETLPGGALLKYSTATVTADPLKNLPLSGELWRVDIVDARWKDQLFQRFNVHVTDPGAWLLEEGIAADYLFQMGGEIKREKKDKRGRLVVEWVQVHENHALDCEKYQLVATHVFRLCDQLPAETTTTPAPLPDAINPYTGKPIGS
jgi:phage terminase large subunit GpA-like protein